MSGSLTVIGGHSGRTLTGLVTIPVSQPGSLIAGLQSTLTALSTSVTGGSEGITNVDTLAGTTFSTGPTVASIYEITNTNSLGGVTSGSASVSATLGVGVNALIVEAPGADTITGNGSSNFLAIFGANSSVTYSSDGGSGTVVASSGDFINVSGEDTTTGWSVLGSSTGGDTINSTSYNSYITTAGSVTGAGADSNVIGLAGVNATVAAGGNNDLVATYAGNNVISVTGGANVLISGGIDTVYAAAGSTSVKAFFFGGTGGGLLDFINQSSSTASVTGSSGGASGSVTVFGGTEGGYYQGGTSGNNSLVGGTGDGSTTLIGGGDNNFLSVQGSGANALFASDAGSSTLVAGTGTESNLFQGGTGTDIMSSEGASVQSYFMGTSGAETVYSSTVTGATNNYYFDQTTAQGGGFDVIMNFNTASDQGFINPFTEGTPPVVISSVTQDGASSLLNLSDGTTVKLQGVTLTSAQITSVTGSNHF